MSFTFQAGFIFADGDVQWTEDLAALPAEDRDRVAFVQSGDPASEALGVGDVVLLRPGQSHAAPRAAAPWCSRSPSRSPRSCPR